MLYSVKIRKTPATRMGVAGFGAIEKTVKVEANSNAEAEKKAADSDESCFISVLSSEKVELPNTLLGNLLRRHFGLPLQAA